MRADSYSYKTGKYFSAAGRAMGWVGNRVDSGAERGKCRLGDGAGGTCGAAVIPPGGVRPAAADLPGRHAVAGAEVWEEAAPAGLRFSVSEEEQLQPVGRVQGADDPVSDGKV